MYFIIISAGAVAKHDSPTAEKQGTAAVNQVPGLFIDTSRGRCVTTCCMTKL